MTPTFKTSKLHDKRCHRCRFCGMLDAEVQKGDEYYFVICKHCEASGPWSDDEESAIRFWNGEEAP